MSRHPVGCRRHIEYGGTGVTAKSPNALREISLRILRAQAQPSLPFNEPGLYLMRRQSRELYSQFSVSGAAPPAPATPPGANAPTYSFEIDRRAPRGPAGDFTTRGRRTACPWFATAPELGQSPRVTKLEMWMLIERAPNRIQSLDGLRCIAALVVVVHHYRARWTQPIEPHSLYPYGSLFCPHSNRGIRLSGRAAILRDIGFRNRPDALPQHHFL